LKAAASRVKVQGAIPTPDELVLARSPRRSSGKHFAACLKTLAAAIKGRWVCEQAHQQMKEALGLDHLEGRSWQGLHRHVLSTMIAYAFLQHQRLKQARRKKESIPGYRNQLCRPSDAPSSRRYRENKSANDVPTAEWASEPAPGEGQDALA
jgi:Transposase DDE domain